MIHFVKQDGQFIPLTKEDQATWNKIKEGKVYAMRYKGDRNVLHHRKLFAIAKMIIDNEPEGSMWENKTPYTLIKSTELQLGYVNQNITFDGEIIMEPESINFELWGQEKFEEFYDKALNFWAEHFGHDRNVLEEFCMEEI